MKYCFGYGILNRSFVFLCLYCIFTFTAIAEQGEYYEVNLNQNDAELILLFTSAPTYTTRSTEQGLVVNVDKDLGGIDLSSALTELSPWLESLWAGYDSFVLKSKQGVDVDLSVQGNRLYVSFTIGDSENKQPETADTNANLAVERAKALLLLESGQPVEARLRIRELRSTAPDSVELMLDLARVEERLNKWREALSLYEQAQQLKPDAVDVTKAIKRLLDNYGAKVTGGVEFVESGDTSRLKIAHFEGRKLLHNKMLVSVDYDAIDAEEDSDIRHTNGELKPFDVVRHRLAIELETSLREGVQRFSIYGGAKQLGLGWAYSQTGDYGVTQADIEWGRPWFRTPEAVVGYGRRDRVMIGHSQTFIQQLTAYGELSLNQYGLEDIDAAAKSYRVQIGGQYWFGLLGSGFFIGYGLDYEDMVDHEKRTDSLGEEFTPLPLESREQHVIGIGWDEKYEEHLKVNTKLGYEFDPRRDSSAPFGHFYLTYKPARNIEWDVGVETGLSSYENEDESYLRVTTNLTWLF